MHNYRNLRWKSHDLGAAILSTFSKAKRDVKKWRFWICLVNSGLDDRVEARADISDLEEGLQILLFNQSDEWMKTI